ncbi:MAG: phage major capsid protein [Candidatus Gastranaerophilales bacterium]|nr:phage major capsid protein [Candidatus Gastranaerophilales bacterium]
MKSLKEILVRKTEIRSLFESNKEMTDDEIDTLETELRELEKAQKSIEKRQEIAKGISTGAIIAKEIAKSQNEERTYGRDSAEYRSAFFKTLAGVQLNDVEKRAMTTNSSSAGVAVPTVTMNKIYEKIENDSVVYGLVTVSHLSGNVSIPLEGTTNAVERKGEGEDGTIQDDTLAELKLSAKKYIKLVRLTCELENTAIDALEDYIVNKLSKKLVQAFDTDIISGTGSGATGILTTITPTSTAVAGEWDYDDICDLFADIPAKARKNATLMMSTNTLYKQIKTIKDSNKHPIFDPASNKVLGRDVTECDDVPDGTIIFGDFSEYMFNWSKDAQITKSEESAFASGDTVYRILALADGGLADLGAITAKEAGDAEAE